MKSKLQWLINNFEELLAALILLSMAILAFTNVVTRYLINYSLAFTEELEITGMVWLTMFGVAIAFKREMHLRLRYLDRYVKPKTQIILQLISLSTSFILFSVLGYLSLFHIKAVIELEITTEALEIPEWIYLLIIPMGCLFINLRLLELAIKKLIIYSSISDRSFDS